MFNKDYYDRIYGGIHRHDYAEDLANRLISKYHPKSFLGIGTGCGYLVKLLRDKGVDAHGVEISEYAMAHSHGNIILGDIRHIPFERKFDLVFSQGVWPYLPEEDLDEAWAECLRVGRFQEHYIDYKEAEEAPNFEIAESESWWNARLPGIGIKEYPKILVACPIHELKEYSFAEWIDCVNKLDYPNYDVLVVDNSPTTDFYERWKDKVPMIHLPDQDQSENASARINASMTEIQKHFLEGNYSYWFNLESDVIVEPDAINFLMQFKANWVGHGYPMRGGEGMETGIGCALLDRELVEIAEWTSNVHGADATLWQQVQLTHSSITLTRCMPIKHIGSGVGHA